jgi:hypothetical protein
MKLEIFQSSHGDCVLLESEDGKRILCDGGEKTSMMAYVAPALDKLRQAEPERPIDVVYVSHIDADHIGGVLQLLDDEVEWRVYDHHVAEGDDFDPPDRPRPPRIDNIWHNAFGDQVDKRGAIEDLLAAAAPVLASTQSDVGNQAAFEMQQISLGVDQALRVSKLVAPQALGIPLNAIDSAGPAKLLMVRPGQKPIRLGSLEITIIGPTEAELADLREGWKNWLDRSAEKVKSINREIKRRVEEFAESSNPQPISLFDWEGMPGFKGVTVPNLASLVLFVREGDRTLLLTGDAQHDLLLGQLREAGLLDDGHLHLDVLKVQHHGSTANMNPKFARTVSADHYVFCGDGAHGNPEPDVIQQIYNSRMSTDPDVRARAPEAQDDRPFHFWFSTSLETPAESAKDRANFRKAETLVRELKKKSSNRLKTHYNEESSIELAL